MGERKQMTYYDEDFIKKIMQFDKNLDGKIWKKLYELQTPQEKLDKIMWDFPTLQIAVKILFMVIESEMHQTNKMKEIISKLPDDGKFEELKMLFEERDNDIEKTIKPLSDYTKQLEESRKRKPDYIG